MNPSMRKIEIQPEELRKNLKLFVATPMYGGNCMEPYFRSCIQLITFFNKHGVNLAFGTIANESLITRARNVLVSYFLNSNYTHLLFIDGDIEFSVEDVLKLYVHDKDVVVGAYPKKGVAWDRIKMNLLANPEVKHSNQEIAAFGSDYAINFKFVNRETKSIAIENGLVKLHDAGTGFMMIKREAIEKMIKEYPDLKYNNDVTIQNRELDEHFYALFDTMIDPIDKRYLSEDYTFCRRWQNLGGDIYLDPTISLNHYGHFAFRGNPSAIIDYTPFVQASTNKYTDLDKEIKTFDLPG